MADKILMMGGDRKCRLMISAWLTEGGFMVMTAENRAEGLELLRTELPDLVIAPPKQEKEVLTLTLSGREAIPELLSVLVQKGLHIYRLAPQEVNLEEVYFALHGGAE